MNEEVKRRYVDPVNRNLDIILIIVAIVLSAAFLILYYQYNQNELGKIKFKKEEFKDITWVSELNDIKFNVTDDTLNFSIDSTIIVKDGIYTLNAQTGEITIVDYEDKIFIRAVSSNSLTIWYNKAEYHLEKEKKY